MSVWPSLPAAEDLLTGSEGPLTCVSVEVDARRLESLLETLAHLPMPINPQIFHSAVVVYRYPNGRESIEEKTLVEFPAYGCHVDEVRSALKEGGFDEFSLHITRMLDEIQGQKFEPAPPGAPYVARLRVKDGEAWRHSRS